jgi:CRISPR-associated protein Csb2
MKSNLCLTVRFLQPYYHGRCDGGEPEWPPSPLRVFQSIVAAAAARWQDSFHERAVPALRWLEQLPPPSIVAAPAEAAQSKYRLYVPDNVADKVAKSWTGGREASIADYRTEKDVRPMKLSGEAVHYLVPLARDGSAEIEVLTAASRSITHLGWGVDMVAGDASLLSNEEAARLPGERWNPVSDAAAAGYRVPIAGTLDALIKKHQAFLNRLSPDGFQPVSPLSAFQVVRYRRSTELPGGPHAAFRLLHPVLDRMAWFSAARANRVAAMTRHAAAMAAAQQPREWVDSYVHGHRGEDDDTKPRFSYLPLPTIENQKGKLVAGGIRRVIVAEQRNSQQSYLTWARQMLPGQFLIDEQSNDRKAMLAPLAENDWVLKQYTDRAETWATTTPVVLPGSDDGKASKAEKLFLKALVHAGYSAEALADLEFRNVSFWPGGDLALRFHRPEYLRKGCWSVYHVRIRWKQPVAGPVALGAGRHCGLGVFAALRERGEA